LTCPVKTYILDAKYYTHSLTNVTKQFTEKTVFSFLNKKNAKKFGEIAVMKGLASMEDIDAALRLQKEYHEKNDTHKEIGQILIEKGVLKAADVKAILEEQKRGTGLMAWFSALAGLSR
jgi:hypothetical protein